MLESLNVNENTISIYDDIERFPLFNKVKANHDVSVYINEQDKTLSAMGFTEHNYAHVEIVKDRTGYILETLGYDDHTIDLALCAAWMHDIGNVVNRVNHSQTGAIMAFNILSSIGVPSDDIAPIIRAIGNHDEGDGIPVSLISAALILSDKSDVRRSRVLKEMSDFDKHDKVNYSVTSSSLKINEQHTLVELNLEVDTEYSEIGEFFEIFMERFLLCHRAAKVLNLDFNLIINNQKLM